MKRRAYLLSGAAAASALAGCSLLASNSLSEDDYDVGMSASAFLPAEHEASVGDTVVWGNTSQRGHTVTAYGDSIPADAEYFASGGFGSQSAAEDAWTGSEGRVDVGETYSHTFSVAGEYRYFCIPHEPQGMVGRVVVTD